MTKLLTPLRLALCLATVFAATGCELYFGGHDGNGDGDRWTYCGSDGYYVCNGDSCEWAGARCPDDPNYTCTDDKDCAAGCFCATNGTCEEAGFCGSDADCPDGYHCDAARSSCEPDGPQVCTQDTDCAEGSYCSPDGVCTPTCTCATDAEAQAQGFGYCDENRGTCEPQPPYGTCGGTATCNQLPPTCPEGQVPLLDGMGCYAGGCLEINLCDVPAGCKAIQHESDCLADATCTSVYAGINCTNPQGQQCIAGQANCTCERFDYASCTNRIVGRQVINSSTGYVDMAQYLSH